jgi:nanoRNase/pAp phosphatase (c-di-AMP/oligoRNAs hydrolase)
MGHIAHFTLSLCLFLPLTLTIAQDKPAYEQRNQPVTKEDLQILQRADKILSSEAVWNRNDTRVCKPEDKTWSLFCALQKASIEVLGKYDHRRVALQEVRFVIEEVAKGKDLGGHRLMGYNNLPSTQFKDIKRVLKMATEKVAARLKAQQRA